MFAFVDDDKAVLCNQHAIEYYDDFTWNHPDTVWKPELVKVSRIKLLVNRHRQSQIVKSSAAHPAELHLAQ